MRLNHTLTLTVQHKTQVFKVKLMKQVTKNSFTACSSETQSYSEKYLNKYF